MNTFTKISKSLLSVAFLMLAVVAVQAQEDEESSFSISGSVDAYFHSSIGTVEDAPGTSFANLPGFSLGMVNTIFTYEGEKVGFVGDLVFGPRGADAVFNSPYYSLVKGSALNASSQIINQLYVYWNVSDALTFTLGNFNTFLGYEVISPTANFNYSTSYMFSYGPFSHTGIKADVALTDNLSAMLAVMNPTDLTEFNPLSSVAPVSNTYSYGFQLGYENDNGGAWLNFLYGDQDGKLAKNRAVAGDTSATGALFQVDLTTGWNLTETFYLGFNATYQTVAAGETSDGTNISDIDGDPTTFMGVALYPQYAISEPTSIGLRFEYFAEGNGGVGAIGTYDANGDASIIDLTLSLNHKVGNLTIIPEFRVDLASEDGTFTKDNDSFEATKTLPTFNLAAVYAF